MNKRVEAILKSLLKDIASDDADLLLDAETTLNCPTITNLLLTAGCQENILNAMKETVALSHIERVYCCTEIKKSLHRNRD